MNHPNEKAILEKLRQLSPERVAEVEDFVDFLRSRGTDEQLTRVASKLSESTFARIWDNPDDAVYDTL